ncbi:hypothetical protein [Pontibacter sp. G13]|uniref:hypothetical protein n=1 Tax=Pontibacter sp. G13 TaxID=3074898 RepID=UPI002889795F|nr:hypothetical protein [Pontibacter sp. G13]WNJ19927.1 hypothetical protein RJD25_05540 [Pontibacter sp. G13]
MPRLYFLLFPLLAAPFYSVSQQLLERFPAVEYAEPLSVPNYRIVQTLKLDDDRYLLVGAPTRSSEQTAGLRLYLLCRQPDQTFTITAESVGIGDSDIYRSYVFAYDSTRILVVSEPGTEYAWEPDLHWVEGTALNHIGNLDVVINYGEEKQGEPTIGHLRIWKDEEGFSLDLQGGSGPNGHPVYLLFHPGQASSRLYQRDQISYHWTPAAGLQLSLTGQPIQTR